MAESNNSAVKGISVILMILALITGMAAIVTPMRNEISALHEENKKTEERLNKRIDDVARMIEMALEDHKESSCREQTHNDRSHEDLRQRIEFIERNFMNKPGG